MTFNSFMVISIVSANLGVYEAIKSFIDKVFSVPLSFLNLAIEKLDATRNIVAQGLNVGKYMSIFGDLPREWQWVVTSLLACVVLLTSLFLVRALLRMYFATKEGVKWW